MRTLLLLLLGWVEEEDDVTDEGEGVDEEKALVGNVKHGKATSSEKYNAAFILFLVILSAEAQDPSVVCFSLCHDFGACKRKRHNRTKRDRQLFLVAMMSQREQKFIVQRCEALHVEAATLVICPLLFGLYS